MTAKNKNNQGQTQGQRPKAEKTQPNQGAQDPQRSVNAASSETNKGATLSKKKEEQVTQKSSSPSSQGQSSSQGQKRSGETKTNQKHKTDNRPVLKETGQAERKSRFSFSTALVSAALAGGVSYGAHYLNYPGLSGSSQAVSSQDSGQLKTLTQQLEAVSAEVASLKKTGSSVSSSGKTSGTVAQADKSKNSSQTGNKAANAGAAEAQKLSALEERLSKDVQALNAKIASLSKDFSSSQAVGQATGQNSVKTPAKTPAQAGTQAGTAVNATGTSSSGLTPQRGFAAQNAQAVAQAGALAALVKGLEQKISGLSQEQQKLKQDVSSVQTKVKETNDHLSKVQVSQKETQQQGTNSAKIIALTTLESALTSGQSFASELQTAKTVVGQDPALKALLEKVEPFVGKTVPSAAALEEEFKGLSSKAFASTKLKKEAGLIDRLGAVVSSAVTVRRVGGEGSEVEQHFAQIEEGLKTGHLSSVVKTVAELPGQAPELLKEWQEKLLDRQALNDISAQLKALSLQQIQR